jgi:hypothetical protein
MMGRAAPSISQIVHRTKVKASSVVANCRCGAFLFRCKLKDAQTSPEAHNVLIRQAIRKHAVDSACEKATEAVVRVDVESGTYLQLAR